MRTALSCSFLIAVIGSTILLTPVAQVRADDFDDAKDAVEACEKATKDAQDNYPGYNVRGPEDKLDQAEQKLDDLKSQTNPPAKSEAIQAAQDARDQAQADANQARKDADPDGDFTKKFNNYRDALKRRREACKKLKELIPKMQEQISNQARHINDDTVNKNKRSLQKARDCVKKCGEPPTITMAMPGAPGVPAGGPTFASLVSNGQLAVNLTGTGETIGDVALLSIQNLTDQPISFAIPPVILESRSGKNQDYVIPQSENVALKPHESKKVPVNGVCVNRHKPPVGEGVGNDLAINDPNGGVPRDEQSHVKRDDADKLLRIAKSKYDAADKLEKDGQLKDIPYKDKKKRMEIVEQWSTWTDPRISEIEGGPPATKDDLKKVVYKQVPHEMTTDEKKKIDKGIDTIFDKIELTTKKAKDLEKPEPFQNVELTGEEGKGQRAPENVGMPTPTPQSETGTSTTSTPTPATQEKPAEPKVSKPLEKPCPDGKLVARHAYSECGPDGFWHVVEDAYYNCPPVKAFRVADEVTKQPCGGGQAPPTGVVAPVYKEFEGGSTDCQSPKPTDQFIYVSECIGKVWETKTYRIYECLDGSKRIKSPPESVVRSTTECDKPPPPPPH